MSALHAFVSRLRGALTQRRHEAALAEEIETHLALLADEFEARGLSREAAARAARREFGGVAFTRESARRERGFAGLESVAQDVRFALRQLRRAPSFALAAVLTLAIGIGGTTAIYSVFDIVAIRPLPYPHAERLVTLQESLPTFGPFPVSLADADYWRAHTTSFETIAIAANAAVTLTGNGEPERLSAGLVTPDFLPLLGAVPQLGRLLVADDDIPGRDRVVVIDDGLWRRRFEADPDVVGRTVLLDGVSHEIVGVLQPAFRPPNTKWLHSLPTREVEARLWKPLAATPEQKPAVGGYSYSSLARLRAGVAVDAARDELAAAQRTLVGAIARKGDLRTVVSPLQTQMASRSRDSLVLILLAVATVLLIGCANIASLLIARTLSRQRELAVREALGAGRLRIARQLAVEHLLLAGLGGLAGLGVAAMTFRLIVWMAPPDLPQLETLLVDRRVLLVAALVSAAAAALLGTAPTVRATAFDLHSALKARRESGMRPAVRRLHALLVIGEIAAGTMVVALAMLLTDTFGRLLRTEHGFQTDRLLTTTLSLAGPRYEAPAARAALFDSLDRDLRGLAGIDAVAVASQLPMTGTGALSAVTLEGTAADVASRPSSDVRSVSSDFFRAFGLRRTRGRLLEPADRDRLVVVVTDSLARQVWPTADPVGQTFRFGANPAAPVYTVVGTVADLRAAALDQPVSPLAFVPFPQRSGSVTLVVRATGERNDVVTAIRDAMRRRDPDMPIGEFRAMTDVVAASLAPRRFQLQLVGFFAVTAALLAALGIYGTLAYAVAQRQVEIGVRLALGERSRSVVARVIREAAQLTAIGIAAALLLAAGSRPVLQRLVSVTAAGSLRPVLGAVLVSAVMALLAAAIPAMRASRVDPASALRSE